MEVQFIFFLEFCTWLANCLVDIVTNMYLDFYFLIGHHLSHDETRLQSHLHTVQLQN